MNQKFNNDYSIICHPKVLEKINALSNELHIGYSLDALTQDTVNLIKNKMEYQNCDIHFLAGGTQTNMVAISSFLKRFEAVICANNGHINVHETGAIEGCGNKILICDSFDGKVIIKSIEEIVNAHIDEHMVRPKLVYISNSTEIGTVYTKKELEELREVCNKYDMYLYMDGARLGSALTSRDNDLTLNDICDLCDAFYIGGTKNGACLGEALVIINDDLKYDMRFYIKNKGAMLSKGFFASLNFNALFIDDLFFEIGKKQNEVAQYLYQKLDDIGFDFLIETKTNLVFPILEKTLVEKLNKEYLYSIWQEFDHDFYVVRFVTSIPTTTDDVDLLIEYIKKNLD